MFKRGDKVVLIDNDDLDENIDIELYNQYIVEGYVGNKELNIRTPLIILKGVSAALAGDRFISITSFRKQKIKKLLSKYDKC
jgi:hypothetical protein